MSKYISPQKELSRSSDWISNFFIQEGYHTDFTLNSLAEVDKFFKEKTNLVLENDNNRNLIFSISAYIGEVIKKRFKGKWELSRAIDLDDESIAISFKDYNTIYPLNMTFEIIRKKYTVKEFLKENFNILI